ncbi:hypothetical protein JAAARDRAFT_195874 [Jaapia argillacea MUCL 33604]|uniref:Serine/threonine-protein phosphatase n=1 Tax=Jaapia argillacea MUCL 33604 TaxID=933084 RepID=A0A067PYT3_9AGAM|nr:hypothetical protein JAAARDRAFT_195874 [Jaapia argillacea MUCL 33604]
MSPAESQYLSAKAARQTAIQGPGLQYYKPIPGHPEFTEEHTQLRNAREVPEPAYSPPTDGQLWVYNDVGQVKPDIKFLKRHFFHEGRLTEDQALALIDKATEVLSTEPNLLNVSGPVTICGDIHGQYYDLMKLFEVGGNVSDSNYLFLGDYVDRGNFGLECLLYLYALKLWYPNRFFLLRGNHECRHLTEYFTFKRECLHKYSHQVYDACIKSFNALPVAALVDHRFFCVHGGISPELNTLEDIWRLDRFQEPGSHGLLCDLLWADPVANYGREHEQDNGLGAPGQMFYHNLTRGCSWFYTYDAVCAFLERNGLLGVIRGHEAQDAGYTMHRKTPTKKFPSVITIFSAPNYLDAYHNRGAVLKYHNKNITIRQFNWSSHPYWLPNFMDAFTWSLPFVGEKIADMLMAVLAVCSEEELEESSDEDDTRTIADLALTPNEIAARRQQIKNKILAVGKMQRVFQLLREEAENASELVTESPTIGHATLAGPNSLTIQGNSIRQNIRSFDDARRVDMVNERLPEFSPTAFPLVPVPSMRPQRTDNMEILIKRVLEEDEGDGGVVERVAERIARGRKPTGRPRALKRHETA